MKLGKADSLGGGKGFLLLFTFLGFKGRGGEKAAFGSEVAWLGRVGGRKPPLRRAYCARLCPYGIFNPQDSARLGMINSTLR